MIKENEQSLVYRAPHIIIVTTVPGQNLNPGPLSLEESALLTELTKPDRKNNTIVAELMNHANVLFKWVFHMGFKYTVVM